MFPYLFGELQSSPTGRFPSSLHHLLFDNIFMCISRRYKVAGRFAGLENKQIYTGTAAMNQQVASRQYTSDVMNMILNMAIS